VRGVLPTLSGDSSALARAASVYVDKAPHLMAAMYTSLQFHDADGLRKVARRLRMAADALHAERLREIAWSIEQACQFCDLCLLRPAVEDCLAEVACLRAALRPIAGEAQPQATVQPRIT
jgi:hypothetical protein